MSSITAPSFCSRIFHLSPRMPLSAAALSSSNPTTDRVCFRNLAPRIVVGGVDTIFTGESRACFLTAKEPAFQTTTRAMLTSPLISLPPKNTRNSGEASLRTTTVRVGSTQYVSSRALRLSTMPEMVTNMPSTPTDMLTTLTHGRKKKDLFFSFSLGRWSVFFSIIPIFSHALIRVGLSPSLPTIPPSSNHPRAPPGTATARPATARPATEITEGTENGGRIGQRHNGRR